MISMRISLLALGLALASAPAWSQTGTTACGEEREVGAGMLSEPIYRRLNDIFEMFGEEEFSEAYRELQRLSDRRLSDYEQASVAQAMGFAASQQENYRQAIEHFRDSIELDAMPNSQHFEMILQIAQLYNATEQYDRALEQLDYWFCVSTEESRKQAEVWLLKANLHIQKEEYRDALVAIDEALALREDPPDSWYRAKLGMHLELEEYRPATEVLKILINLDPNRKDYWIQLAGSHLELNENEQAMAAMRLAWRKGLFNRGSEFTQLAGLLQEMDSPRQAAEVLQEGLEGGFVDATARNWEMTAGAWYEARELDKALVAYERAGELSESGTIDFQRASILTNQEDWEDVIAAAGRALEKGDLNNTQEGNSHLLMGMAHFNLGDLDAAERAFNQASNYGRLRSAAQEWLNHVRQTRQRMASS